VWKYEDGKRESGKMSPEGLEELEEKCPVGLEEK